MTSYCQFTFLSALFSDDEDDIPVLATVDHAEDNEDYSMDVNDFAVALDHEFEVNAEACAGASDDEDMVFHSHQPVECAWTPLDSEDDVDDLGHNTALQEDPSGDDEVDDVDWDALEKECGLSA